MILARDMDGLPCLMIVVIIAVVAAIAWYNRARRRDLRQAFVAVARWYHGRYTRDSFWSHPKLVIPYGETTIEITPGHWHGRRSMDATMDWPDPVTNVYVASNSMNRTVLRTLAGDQNIVPLGEREFERSFTAYSEDPAAARAVLTGGVRSSITMLGRIRGGPVSVLISDGKLMVQKMAALDQPSELSAFVRHTMDLYDQAMLSRSVGIQFVEHTQLQTIEDARCPVCGDTILEDLVFCGRCKTPHHRECWNYCGKCATYGCGETEFTVPRIAKPR
jgi:hypothetical protein